MILIHTADLMFAVKIDSTARSLGYATAPVRTLERLGERLETQADTITGVIVELDPQSICLDVIRAARSRRPELPIVAFGPHVLTSLLESAGEAGANSVMPRGQFVARMSGILKQLAESGTSAEPAANAGD